MALSAPDWTIRPCKAHEYAALGKLLVSAYAGLPGMPTPQQQPDYYAMLADVGTRVARPSVTVFVATDEAGQLLGSIDYIDDMTHYGSGGTAPTIADAAGLRLLAVSDVARGRGVGKALVLFCIEQARRAGKARVVLHTTKMMRAAWKIYEGLGFVRFPELDFQQSGFDVFGFQLDIAQR
ncbi:GNAT family N-acetyltransferase [Bradyrhizobium lablabi]|uniref:GNAT family N-acetyltransferase n=1 Tax=Bradyrhizobium lablabi TaxID=722472 RepID=UPI001BA98D20|nr:GNAT family N-acetyltransferase [Bradyrhizobium lablabi]MBR0697108.1 GNAT family N-acetyltransferase [Bradyrhizobium lablabi]